MATGLEKVSFHFNLKERQYQRMLKLLHKTALISHTSKVMLKILQARLQQYVNCEIPDVQMGFRKGRGARDQIANIHWITKKARELQKNICFIEHAKPFDCVLVKVAQSCPTLCDPMDYTAHGILQAEILEWVTIYFSGRSP